MSAAHFSFRLERLLAIRERAEAEAALAFAAARARADALRTTAAELQARREALRADLLPAVGATRDVGVAAIRILLLNELDARAATLVCEIATADVEAEERQREMSVRLRERRVLERLRERQLALWKIGEARREREQMDEAAQRRSGTTFVHHS